VHAIYLCKLDFAGLLT